MEVDSVFRIKCGKIINIKPFTLNECNKGIEEQS